MSRIKPHLATILPCYNEAPQLADLTSHFVDAARRHGFHPHTFRLVLVDNGSTDATPEVLQALAASEHGEWIDIVRVPFNQGYGHGLYAGLVAADAEFLSWTHADGQCSAEDVFRAFRTAALQEHALCMGRREGRGLGSWLFSRGLDLAVLLLVQRWVFDVNAQPKVFPQKLVNALENPPSGFAFDLYVLLRAQECRYSILSVPVYFGQRKHGQSSWAIGLGSRIRTIRSVLDFIVDYSLRRFRKRNAYA